MRFFKPIQMSPNMVAAILAGNKRRTRRIMKPQPVLDDRGFWNWPLNPRSIANGRYASWSDGVDRVTPMPLHSMYNQCPYPPSTVLWVREKWAVAKDYDHLKPCDFSSTYPEGINQIHWWIIASTDKVTDYGNRGRWRSALHLPKSFARIILEVKSVTATRLQTITPEQAIESGIETDPLFDFLGQPYYTNYGDEDLGYKLNPVESYRTLWNSLHGPKSWDKNPWVWDIEFDVLAPTKYDELKANTETKKARILHEEII